MASPIPYTCEDWTGDNIASSNQLVGGIAGGGSSTWTRNFLDTTPTDCWNTGTAPLHRLYCFETDFTATVSAAEGTPKPASPFVSKSAFASGAGINAAHTLCQNEASAASLPAANTFKALLRDVDGVGGEPLPRRHAVGTRRRDPAREERPRSPCASDDAVALVAGRALRTAKPGPCKPSRARRCRPRRRPTTATIGDRR